MFVPGRGPGDPLGNATTPFLRRGLRQHSSSGRWYRSEVSFIDTTTAFDEIATTLS
jgi:hypothetical protein